MMKHGMKPGCFESPCNIYIHIPDRTPDARFSGKAKLGDDISQICALRGTAKWESADTQPVDQWKIRRAPYLWFSTFGWWSPLDR